MGTGKSSLEHNSADMFKGEYNFKQIRLAFSVKSGCSFWCWHLLLLCSLTRRCKLVIVITSTVLRRHKLLVYKPGVYELRSVTFLYKPFQSTCKLLGMKECELCLVYNKDGIYIVFNYGVCNYLQVIYTGIYQ